MAVTFQYCKRELHSYMDKDNIHIRYQLLSNMVKWDVQTEIGHTCITGQNQHKTKYIMINYIFDIMVDSSFPPCLVEIGPYF